MMIATNDSDPPVDAGLTPSTLIYTCYPKI